MAFGTVSVMSQRITNFDHEYAFLSNFYSVDIEFCGLIYSTLEHAYQAAKTEDQKSRAVIQSAKTPGVAKKLGQKVKLKRDWDKRKLVIMENLLRQKFHNKELRQMLLDTGDAELVEGNWWGDKFWGVCQGVGKNHLGRLLMEIRSDIQAQQRGIICWD